MTRNVSILICFFLLSSQSLWAQSPSTEQARGGVPAIEDIRWSEAEYQSEEVKWRNMVKLAPSDQDAWINLYKTVRYAEYGPHDKAPEATARQELEAILTEMKSAVPNSFAFHYCTYLNKGRTAQGMESLQQAIALRPSETELYDDALSLYLISGDQATARVYAQKIRNETPFSATELQYNGNVMLSVEQGSILITNGYIDTYPIMVMQLLDGVRTDITVVCLDWLVSDEYRKQISSQAGVNIPSGSRAEHLAALLNAKVVKPVYASLTLPPADLSRFKKNLFSTGLALKFSQTGIMNIQSLVYNWEQLFLKDHIKTPDPLNRNYLIPLFHLKEYYEGKKDDKALQEIVSYISAIASQVKDPSKINTLLGQ